MTAAVPAVQAEAAAASEPGRADATAGDRARQTAVTAAYALFVLAGAWATGLVARVPGLAALGAGSYRAAHEGRYGSATTLFSLSPLHPLIWPVLWAALGAYTLAQWSPSAAAAERHRRTGGAMAGALLALAAAPLAVLTPWGLEAVAWAVALLLTVRVILRLSALPSSSRVGRTAVDGGTGLLAGVLVAGLPTALAGACTAWGLAPARHVAEPACTALLLGVLVLAARLVLTGRGRMAVALGAGWTLLNLGVTRLVPPPLGALFSPWLGIPAVFGTLLLVTLAGARRTAVRQAERRAADVD